MKQTLKKTLALLLVVVQLFVLLPVLQPQAAAVETAAENDLPALNPVIEGTVRFGSFNYLGDKENNRDGVDYVSTFYYSDDYFSRSAVNPKATGSKQMQWTDLEDLSMATLSKDFTIAAFGSSENTFPTQNWAKKDKNAEAFLSACDFKNYSVNTYFREQTNGNADSIGYVFGSKKIRVYDQVGEPHQNREFTLVAVGIRGAGYGAEWSSNLMIGNPAQFTSQSAAGQYRHYGFDSSATTVLNGLRQYLQANNITGDVKYWVCGYSRSGAVANLVAGALSDNQGNAFHTSKEHVYCYTFESAAGALQSEDPDGTRYPNIHNILNAMDVVPLVSPRLFSHDRLGVDYYLPYHANATFDGTDYNETYYRNMYQALKNVAVIAPNYKNKYSGDHDQDPTLTDADPDSYPYGDKIQIKSLSISNFLRTFGGAITYDVSNAESSIPGAKSGLYLDQYLEKLVNALMLFKGWDWSKFKYVDRIGPDTYDPSQMTTSWRSHEYEYVTRYQSALSKLAELALKNPGVGMGVLDDVVGKALSGNVLSTALRGASLSAYYFEMTNTTYESYLYNRAVYNMISPMNDVAQNIIANIELFNSSDLPTVNSKVSVITPVLTWIYSDEHKEYNGEYLGTLLDNVSTILVTHIPELGVSWLMSLDDVFLSDYREITLPKNTAVSMKVLRSGIDYTDESDVQFLKASGARNADIPAVEVASVVDGALVQATCKDQRIQAVTSGDNVIIRYPGNLDVRFDVQAKDAAYTDLAMRLEDYRPVNVVNAKSGCTRAESQSSNFNVGNLQNVWVTRDSVAEHDRYTMTTLDNTPDALRLNGLAANGGSETIPLSGSETLHIMSWHGSNQVYGAKDTTYYVSLDKAPRSVVAEYTMKTVLAENVSELPAGADPQQFEITADNKLLWTGRPSSETKTYAKTKDRSFTAFDLSTISATVNQPESVVDAGYYSTRQTVSVVPAANIYYDDTLVSSTRSADASAGAPNYENAICAIAASGTPVTPDSLVAFKFTGTRVDLYMNTTSSDKFVSAYILDADGNQYVQEGVSTSQLITGKSTGALSNVPVVSFSGLDRGTYTLAVLAPSGSSYTLDGVRVYDESRASYTPVRESLLGTADWTGEGKTTGTVYLDYGQNGSAGRADYTLAGPKREVYLKSGNGVAFAIEDYSASASYRIGLAAVNGETVSLTINDEPYTVLSSTHMFYDLHPNGQGFVVIKDVSGGMLSVTDVEETLPVLTAPRPLRLSASPELMHFAMSLSAPAAPAETAEPDPVETAEPTAEPEITPEPTPEVTPEPTPEATPEPTPESTPEPTEDLGSTMQQLFSSFIRSLFGSISRIFGN